jgi:hypothetical protein
MISCKFSDLIGVRAQNVVFYVVTPCGLGYGYQVFGVDIATFILKKKKDLENGGSVFFLNVIQFYAQKVSHCRTPHSGLKRLVF